MRSLISKGDIEIIDAKESATLTIVRLIEDRELVIDDPTPKPPIPPAVEPLTVIEFPVSPFGEGEEIVVRNSPPPTHGEMDIRATDGNILPILQIREEWHQGELRVGCCWSSRLTNWGECKILRC